METIKNTKRDEIVRTAYAVFYQHGIHATGVDRVLSDTGISKRTLYKYFRSKEDLVAAVVGYYQESLFATVATELAQRAETPFEQILALFDFKYEAFCRGDFAGCLAINIKLEFQGKDGAIENACSHFYSLLEAYLAELCRAATCHNPESTARKIVILFQGGVVMGQMHHDANALLIARATAKMVLESDIALI